MSGPPFVWKSPEGKLRQGASLAALQLPCPVCGASELAGLGPEDGAPPPLHGADLPRVHVCGACNAVVPIELRIRMVGYEVTLGSPWMTGDERKAVVEMIQAVSKQSHHPWRVALEMEAGLPDYRLGELPDIRKAMATAGEMGGGTACAKCGKKPLDPIPDPRVPTVFSTRARLLMPCDGCGRIWAFGFSWEQGSLVSDSADAGDVGKVGPPYGQAYALLRDDDLDAFAKVARPLQGLSAKAFPGVVRMLRAARYAAGDAPPPGMLPTEATRPLLRRLGEESPLFGGTSWSVTCEVAPRLRFSGAVLRTLVQDMQAKAEASGPVSILPDLARWNGQAPFLIKSAPFSQLLGKSLVDLRRVLREAGTRLLPIAHAEGLWLVDPSTGEVVHRLPHMQASVSPPEALGFANRMVYYQEPGVLSVTAHPLVTGAAWRTELDGPAHHWIDLGRYTVFETEAGLGELSGSSGRVRWSLSREDLGGLRAWAVTGGVLVAAGEEALHVIDPGTGEVTQVYPLPKRAEFLALLHGDVPAPAAIIDQGYGPGIFAPASDEIKGVKPIAGAADGGADDLAYITCVGGRVISLWESDIGYAERAVTAGPLEKKFAAKSCLVETELARVSDLALWEDGALAVVPGSPIAVVDVEAGEILHTLEVDGRLGMRPFGDLLLALGEDSLAAIDPRGGGAHWVLEVPGLQAVDMPGPALAPTASRPGYEAPPEVKKPADGDENPKEGGDDA